MKTLAIIPARGGSKRIAKKNIRVFCGEPIIAYSIRAARKSGCFDKIIVSTDSEEIADVAECYGAEVPFRRSDKNSDDKATISDVLTEVLEVYDSRNVGIGDVCCLFSTAPFVTAERLKEAMTMLKRNPEIDTVMPVVKFSYPPQRGLVIRRGMLAMCYPEHGKTRSQDLEPVYHDAGQFLCFRKKPFLETGDLMKTRLSPLVISELEVQDIDDENDWILAEQKYRLLNNL